LSNKDKESLLDYKTTLRITPSVIRDSTTGNRVYYNRYADDWVIGISGDLKMANQIKKEVYEYLLNYLKLTLSEEKTKITHMTSSKVGYLGFYLSRRSRKYTESLVSYNNHTRSKRRASSIIVEAPIDKIISKFISQGFAIKPVQQKPKPKAVTQWIYLTPEEIILKFNAIIRGILEYYGPIENRNQLSYIMWILKFSAAFTLARKLNISPKQVFKKIWKSSYRFI